MSFDSLGLSEALLSAVQAAGYTTATEVQAQAIPAALAGADLQVSSRTGSGKTAAFVLPILMQVLARREANPGHVPAFVPRFGQRPHPAARRTGAAGRTAPHHAAALILAPTRELAQQVAQHAQMLGKSIHAFTVATLVGGMPYPVQLSRLRGGADVLIATPGRLLDLATQNPDILSNIQTLVLDEADRMLDLGFIDDIQAIAAMLPKERQTVMFSATFDGAVGGLSSQLLRAPQRIEVSNTSEQKLQIEQRLHWADHPMHRHALLEHLLADASMDQAVVFAGTQIEAEQMAGQLAELGHSVAALHGGMPQGKRNRTLQGLRRREVRVLVATDVAARGIDVPTISHVINIGLPMKAEDYVHRIGRTGRAGRSGLAVTLALREDLPRLRRLQAYTQEALSPTRIEGLEPKKPEPVIYAQRPRPEGGEARWGAPRGERRPYGERPSFGDRPSYGDRPKFGGAGRPPHAGERRPFGDRPAFGGERPAFGDRRPHGDRPFGDRPAFGDRPQRPEGGAGFAPRHDARPAFRRDERAPFQRDERPAFRRDERSAAPRTEAGRDDGAPRRSGFGAPRGPRRD